MSTRKAKAAPDYSKPTSHKFIDRTGEMHNHWLVESFSHRLLYTPDSGKKQSTTYWNCLCTHCNQTMKAVPYHNLTSGASKSCGCAVVRHERSSVFPGERYGLLEVLSRNTQIKKSCAYWEVKCHGCGRVVNKNTRSLKSTQTCGHPKCRKLLNELGIRRPISTNPHRQSQFNYKKHSENDQKLEADSKLDEMILFGFSVYEISKEYNYDIATIIKRANILLS